MNELRSALFETVTAARDQLDYVTDVRKDSGLLRIVLTLEMPAFNYRKAIDSWLFDCVLKTKMKDPERRFPLPEFRGVNASSLERALRTGIDVEPSNAHWYGSYLEKALEYGGDYPAVLIIDSACIERPFRQIAADAPEEKHAEARAWSVGEPVRSGDWINYSRLPVDDIKRGSPYEAAYAWYIPGDAKEALIGVIECRSGRP